MSRPESISPSQRPPSNDTRLLIVGVVALFALVAYLAVAFVTAHSPPVASGVVTQQRAVAKTQGKPQRVGFWTARSSKLTRLPHTSGGGLAIRVAPMAAGLYGIEIKQLVLSRALRRGFALSFGLRGRGPGRLRVQINTGSAAPIRYLLHTSLAPSRRWHRFTYHGRLEGHWIGVGVFVGQAAHSAAGRWFEIRDLTVRASRR